jgi:hypothetical protein
VGDIIDVIPIYIKALNRSLRGQIELYVPPTQFGEEEFLQFWVVKPKRAYGHPFSGRELRGLENHFVLLGIEILREDRLGIVHCTLENSVFDACSK